jgi:hypothetical protein
MDLQQRVERLERENRRLKRIGFGLLLVAVAIVMWQLGVGQPLPVYGQGKAKNITFKDEEIVIKDKGGKDRVSFGVDSNDRAYFQLRGKEINPHFGIAIDSKGHGTLTFFGSDGGEQIGIFTAQDGKPGINFRAGAVNFYDSNVTLLKSSIDGNPGPAYNLVDRGGKLRASLTLVDKTGPSLRLFHPDGNRMIWLGAEQDGSLLSVFDLNGKRTVQLGTNTTGPELTGLLLDNQYPDKSKTLIQLLRGERVAMIRILDKAGKETIIQP